MSEHSLCDAMTNLDRKTPSPRTDGRLTDLGRRNVVRGKTDSCWKPFDRHKQPVQTRPQPTKPTQSTVVLFSPLTSERGEWTNAIFPFAVFFFFFKPNRPKIEKELPKQTNTTNASMKDPTRSQRCQSSHDNPEERQHRQAWNDKNNDDYNDKDHDYDEEVTGVTFGTSVVDRTVRTTTTTTTTTTMAAWDEFFHIDGLVFLSVEYLDITALVEMKSVCKGWQATFSRAIHWKYCRNKQSFATHSELYHAVRKYHTNRYYMEELSTKYGYPINKWDVSQISDMSCMFSYCTWFNEDVSDWDVSNVRKMSHMFGGAESFNQDLSKWKTGNVTNMSCLFWNANSFNKDISCWDTSKVTNMSGMFGYARAFNQDLSKWKTGNVTDMHTLFWYANSFNQDISCWDTSKVTNMMWMFGSACAFNQDLSDWDTSNVTSMQCMFKDASSFDGDITSWNTSNVASMAAMFRWATTFNQDISSWDISHVNDMDFMFEDAVSFTYDLSSRWDTSNLGRLEGYTTRRIVKGGWLQKNCKCIFLCRW